MDMQNIGDTTSLGVHKVLQNNYSLQLVHNSATF
jgi:hypothetical protein